MPQLGETVTEGTITRWFKNVGDTVARDEVLFEVSTDKVDTEVPSPAGGTLTEIRVPEGDTVEVGTVLAVLGDEGVAPAAAPAAPAAETESPPAAPTPPPAPAAEPPPPAPAPCTSGGACPGRRRGTRCIDELHRVGGVDRGQGALPGRTKAHRRVRHRRKSDRGDRPRRSDQPRRCAAPHRSKPAFIARPGKW